MRALFLTKYSREGASTRYRFLQYIPYLRSVGIDCDVSPLTDAGYLANLRTIKRGAAEDCIKAAYRRIMALCGVKRYDIIVIEYEAMPYFPPFAEAALKAMKIPYIANYDDAVFYRYSLSRNPLARSLLGRKIDKVMRNARLVIAGNSYLADYALNTAHAGRVEILPTAVDTDRYSKTPRPEGGSFTIGWIGSPSTAKYLKAVTPALARVCGESRAKLLLIGSGPVELPGVTMEIRQWREETELNDLASCDVGIMPLDDGLWEKGKCGLKIIQYMASSLPVVASPVGANSEIVVDGVTGILASTNEEWYRALSRVRDDRALRSRLGDAGRKVAEERYSLRVTAPRLAELIKECARQRVSG